MVLSLGSAIFLLRKHFTKFPHQKYGFLSNSDFLWVDTQLKLKLSCNFFGGRSLISMSFFVGVEHGLFLVFPEYVSVR